MTQGNQPQWAAERARVVAFYERQLALYGRQDARALHWVGASTQFARFEVLYRVGPWEGHSVADVGSGLGDFCTFLRQRGHTLTALTEGEADAGEAVRYTGYDVTPNMVQAARLNFPQVTFVERDVVAHGVAPLHDYTLASGTFNVRVPNHDVFFRNAITQLWAGCTKAVAFNHLGPPTPVGYESPLYYEADPMELARFCRSFSPHVVLHTGYLSGDATLFVYKDPAYCPDCAGMRPATPGVHG